MVQSQKEKKVLMISYIFPPLGSGANQRTVRFVKYLGHFGWTPIVLTVRKGYYRYRDEYFLKIVPPSVKIYRAFSLEPARFEPFIRPIKSAIKTLTRWFRGIGAECIPLPSKDSSSINTSDVASGGSDTASGMKDFYKKLVRIFNTYVLIPDGRIGWLPFAVLKGIKIIYKEKPSVIWANADTPSDLLVGCLLKRITGRRLVLNFSDPWVLSPYYPFDRNCFRARIDSLLEWTVIRKANRIVFATNTMQLDYEKEYPDERKNFCTILNGYDPDEFNEIPSYRANEKFILTYCGTLQYFRSPEPLLKALEGLINKYPEIRSPLLVRFVGRIDQENLHYFWSFQHQDILQLVGQVTYQESMRYVFQSDALLIITGHWQGSETEMTGKVFEYLAAKKPILVIGWDSQVAELVKNLKVGIVIRPDNIQSIQSAVLKLMKERDVQDYYKDKEGLIEKYSRKALTGQLAACFDQVLKCA